jgi:SPP1 family predicted phage head-tail adaptor
MGAFSYTLRDRILIQQAPVGKDAAGQRLVDFTDLRQAWADIKTLGGLATIKAGAATSKVQASIRLRSCSDIEAGMRIVQLRGGTVYNVLAVLPGESRTWTDLVCEVLT